jgi:hypothetical protein
LSIMNWLRGADLNWRPSGYEMELDFDGELMEQSVLARASWGAPFEAQGKPVLRPYRTVGLFVAEGYQGVYANGAAGRDVAGGQGNDEEEEGDRCEGEGIGRPDAIEESGHEMRDH